MKKYNKKLKESREISKLKERYYSDDEDFDKFLEHYYKVLSNLKVPILKDSKLEQLGKTDLRILAQASILGEKKGALDKILKVLKNKSIDSSSFEKSIKDAVNNWV